MEKRLHNAGRNRRHCVSLNFSKIVFYLFKGIIVILNAILKILFSENCHKVEDNLSPVAEQDELAKDVPVILQLPKISASKVKNLGKPRKSSTQIKPPQLRAISDNMQSENEPLLS